MRVSFIEGMAMKASRRHWSGLGPEQSCLVIGKRWEDGVLAESGIHHPSRLTLPPVLGLSGVNLLLLIMK